jgi:hypothetical protein
MVQQLRRYFSRKLIDFDFVVCHNVVVVHVPIPTMYQEPRKELEEMSHELRTYFNLHFFHSLMVLDYIDTIKYVASMNLRYKLIGRKEYVELIKYAREVEWKAST